MEILDKIAVPHSNLFACQSTHSHMKESMHPLLWPHHVCDLETTQATESAFCNTTILLLQCNILKFVFFNENKIVLQQKFLASIPKKKKKLNYIR